MGNENPHADASGVPSEAVLPVYMQTIPGSLDSSRVIDAACAQMPINMFAATLKPAGHGLPVGVLVKQPATRNSRAPAHPDNVPAQLLGATVTLCG
ncbi:MAG: hypothetical protein HOO96_35500 [Polyangiaceae bacterium]|nr:hypothetical protein [Polyangiaceae bacterium]